MKEKDAALPKPVDFLDFDFITSECKDRIRYFIKYVEG